MPQMIADFENKENKEISAHLSNNVIHVFISAVDENWTFIFTDFFSPFNSKINLIYPEETAGSILLQKLNRYAHWLYHSVMPGGTSLLIY